MLTLCACCAVLCALQAKCVRAARGSAVLQDRRCVAGSAAAGYALAICAAHLARSHAAASAAPQATVSTGSVLRLAPLRAGPPCASRAARVVGMCAARAGRPVSMGCAARPGSGAAGEILGAISGEGISGEATRWARGSTRAGVGRCGAIGIEPCCVVETGYLHLKLPVKSYEALQLWPLTDC